MSAGVPVLRCGSAALLATLAILGCRAEPAPSPSAAQARPPSAPDTTTTTKPAAPRSAPATAGAARSTPAREPDLLLSWAWMADALGNKDGLVSGVERNIAAALQALPVGARCWALVRRSSAGRSYRRRAYVHELASDLNGLRCGAHHRGLPPDAEPPQVGEREGALLVWRTDAGMGLDLDAHIAGGERRKLTVRGQADEPAQQEATLAAVGARLLHQLRGEPDCLPAVRASLRQWEADAKAGRCPVERLERWDRLDDQHSPGPQGPCAPVAWQVATLDLAAVQRCTVAPDHADALGRAALLCGQAPFRTSWFDVLDLDTEPLDELGVHCPGSFDRTRCLQALRALRPTVKLPPKLARLFVELVGAVPMGLGAGIGQGRQ